MGRNHGYSTENLISKINWSEYCFEQLVKISKVLVNTNSSQVAHANYNLPLKLQHFTLFNVPATEVVSCQFDEAEHKFLIKTARLSFDGVCGAFPLNYCDMLNVYARKKNFVTAEFIEIFHLHILNVSYNISQKRFPAIANKRLEESFVGRIISSFLGNKSNLHLNSLIPYNSNMWQRSRNINGLLSILRSYFSWSVTVQECVGDWEEGTDEQISRIGVGSAKWNVLGKGMMLGKRTWNQSKYIVLEVDAVDYQTYKNIVIKTKSMEKVISIIRYYCGITVSVRIRTITTVSPDELKKDQKILGYNSWLTSGLGEAKLSSAYIEC